VPVFANQQSARLGSRVADGGSGSEPYGPNYINCSKGNASPHLLISGDPGMLLSAQDGAEMHGLPLIRS
jgi:hypothetical protein